MRTPPSPALAPLIEGMRQGGLDFAASPQQARADFAALLETMPAPPDADFAEIMLGGVPALRYGDDDTAKPALLYLHGGAYISGSARGYRGLAAAVARAAGATAFALDYRLAPEAPFPAAIEDVVAAYRALLAAGHVPDRVALVGDSAGGGLAMAALLKLRDEGLPMPAAGLLLSPWVDLTCSGASMESKASADPSLTAPGLRASAGYYLGERDPRDPLASPIFADLSGLPPLLIHVGSSEILMDDAVALAAAAGRANTYARLEIWPEMIHVWHGFHFMLPEGEAAVATAGAFLRDEMAA